MPEERKAAVHKQEEEQDEMTEILGYFVGTYPSVIPPMGGSIAPKGTSAMDLAHWILPEHRPALGLVLSMSMTWAQQQDGYQLMNHPHWKTVRIGVWWNPVKNHFIVGCRATGIGASGAMEDLKDDRILGGLGKGHIPACDLNIVKEGKGIIEKLLVKYQPSQLLLAGYSLGGAAALCLGTLFPGVTVVSFLGGAPATRPVLQGPGPGRATHYHIVGDLVSSHVDPAAARIIRVDKGYHEFSVLQPHLSGRFLRYDLPPGQPATADQEDDWFVKWAVGGPASVTTTLKEILKGAIHFLLPSTRPAAAGTSTIKQALNTYYARMACQSPIPGSRRFKDPCAATVGTLLCVQKGNTAVACRVQVVDEEID